LIVFATLLAAVGGYRGARYLADRITAEAEANAERAGLFKPMGVESELSEKLVNGEKTVNSLRPMSLIYVMDYETGKINDLAVEMFDTVSMRVKFIYFDTDISYTMTGTLYRSLANGNVLVPQTVMLSELYSYYGNDSAFDAGRLVVSELLGRDIEYYMSFSTGDEPEDFKIRRVTALGVKELYEKYGDKKNADTNMAAGEIASFTELSSYIKDTDVTSDEAPVIRRNESCYTDVASLWELLGNEE
jgi:hypothetical protein